MVILLFVRGVRGECHGSVGSSIGEWSHDPILWFFEKGVEEIAWSAVTAHRLLVIALHGSLSPVVLAFARSSLGACGGRSREECSKQWKSICLVKSITPATSACYRTRHQQGTLDLISAKTTKPFRQNECQ